MFVDCENSLQYIQAEFQLLIKNIQFSFVEITILIQRSQLKQ